jgi:hypothetical protein
MGIHEIIRETRRPFGRTQIAPRRMGLFALKRYRGPFCRATYLPMASDSDSSNATHIISEQLKAMLEMAAQKAFPEATQSELRLKFLDALIAIAQGSPATDDQLDDFLVRSGNERICTLAGCGQRFKRRDRGRDHVRKHLDYRPYACDGRCGKPGW